MTESRKNKITVLLVFTFLLGFMVWGIVKPDGEKSLSERRKLEKFPEFSLQKVEDGSFMRNFEKYALDQFPLRDTFRKVKSAVAFYVMRQSDIHDIYLEKGYAIKQEYPLDEKALEYAVKRFRFVYEQFLMDKDVNIYHAIIPDKNYFGAKDQAVLSMDYDFFVQKINQGMDFSFYIDIMPCLSLEDYYKTDTHWRQEKILPVAEKLANAMGAEFYGNFNFVELEQPFYGVYYGQAALPLLAETIFYAKGDSIDALSVTDFETGKEGFVYDMNKAFGDDPYEMFLAGSKSLLLLERKQESGQESATEEQSRELIVFRDSFSSSLAPLLTEGYDRIWLVDIRYLAPALIDRFITFDKQDVLFLYSTSVLNNSITIK